MPITLSCGSPDPTYSGTLDCLRQRRESKEGPERGQKAVEGFTTAIRLGGEE